MCYGDFLQQPETSETTVHLHCTTNSGCTFGSTIGHTFLIFKEGAALLESVPFNGAT